MCHWVGLHVYAELTIKGSRFQELLEWGFSDFWVKKVLHIYD